jgi:hypothetical protein
LFLQRGARRFHNRISGWGWYVSIFDSRESRRGLRFVGNFVQIDDWIIFWWRIGAARRKPLRRRARRGPIQVGFSHTMVYPGRLWQNRRVLDYV